MYLSITLVLPKQIPVIYLYLLFFLQEICIPEQLKWLEYTNEKLTFSNDKMSSWIKEGIPITTTENSNLFCDQNIYQDVLKAKVRSL